MQKIMGKILLDAIALVSKADYEVIEPIVRIMLHDMPENRPPANLDHWLWLDMRLLADACAESACQNDYFHRYPFLFLRVLTEFLTHSLSLSFHGKQLYLLARKQNQVVTDTQIQ